MKECSRKEDCSNPLKNCSGLLPDTEFLFDNSRGKLRAWCKHCARVTANKYYSNNTESRLGYGKKYALENKDKIKNYLEKNKQKKNAYMSEYITRRCKEDLNYKIRTRLRTKLSEILWRQKIGKSFSTFELLGISIPEFKNHIEKMFQPGMTWENWGVHTWHLDHILPLASFDLTDPKQQEIAFNYKNLQPLWASENLSKGAKLDYSPTNC